MENQQKPTPLLEMINSLGTLNDDRDGHAPKFPKKTASPGRGTGGGVFKALLDKPTPPKGGYSQLALFT